MLVSGRGARGGGAAPAALAGGGAGVPVGDGGAAVMVAEGVADGDTVLVAVGVGGTVDVAWTTATWVGAAPTIRTVTIFE